jgi:single-strand DNA-binding protein
MEGNIAKVRFSLATTEHHKDKNGNRSEHTEWHNVVMWRSLAENAQKLLTKGTQVYLEGKLHTNNWVDKEGNKKSTTEIVAETFVVLQKRDSAQTGSKPLSDGPPEATPDTTNY